MEHVGIEPFVSVITVSLNAARTIEDTLASVSLQRADFDFEHVCVDGGSVDGTRQIIDSWALKSRHVHRLYEADRGIFDAMNKGLRVARGEYVVFLNADDFFVTPTTLASVMRGLTPRSAANPDLVVGDVVMGEPARRGVWRCRNVPRVLPRVRGVGLYPPHQGMFAKRELLQSVGGFDGNLRFAADLVQYYEIERRQPSMHVLRFCVSCMNPGGAANSSAQAIARGSLEIFHYLQPRYGSVRAAAMVLVKTLQSLGELRYGTSSPQRWFKPCPHPLG